jgi:flagellar basal-body rod modification protein FlgD
MHQVLANYILPTIVNTLKPSSGLTKVANAKASGSATATNSTGTTGDLGATFLNILSQELKNQDPTDPVDSTALVGQMISLNQLDQLISINQTLSGAVSSGTATGSVAKPAGRVAHGSALAPAIGGATLSPSAAGAANQLPFDPNTMMPLSFNNGAGIAASINSVINPATLGLSGTANSTSGVK